ncbi:hypothetical protein PLESTM_000780800 [Pleodorina starrii]|nr:hypothetical protein PLESTM_000780800 [Pleodorina starrii]
MQLKVLLSCFGRGRGEDALPGDHSAPAHLRAALSKPSSCPAERAPPRPTDYEQLDLALEERLGSRSQFNQSLADEELALGTFPQLRPHAAISAGKSELEYRRDAMICSRMPAAVTVFSQDGQVVHQNSASVFYLGDRVSSSLPGVDVLALVFQLEPDKLDRMLRDIEHESGGRWRGIVRVPSSLVAAMPSSLLVLQPHLSSPGASSLPLTLPTPAPAKQLPHTRSDTSATVVVDTMDGSPRGVLGRPVGHLPPEADRERAEAAAAAAGSAAALAGSVQHAHLSNGQEPGTRHGGVHGPSFPMTGLADASRRGAVTLQLAATGSHSPSVTLSISPFGPAAAPPFPPGILAAADAAGVTAADGPAAVVLADSAAAGSAASASAGAPALQQTMSGKSLNVGGSRGTTAALMPECLSSIGPHVPMQTSHGSLGLGQGTTFSLDSCRPRSVSTTTATTTMMATPFSGLASLTANGQPPTIVTSNGHFADLTATTNEVSQADFPEGVLNRQQHGAALQRTATCPIGLGLGEAAPEAAGSAGAVSAMAAAAASPTVPQVLVWDAGADPLATSTFGLALGRPTETAAVAAPAVPQEPAGGGAGGRATSPGLGTGTGIGTTTGGRKLTVTGDGADLESRGSCGLQGSGNHVRVVDLAFSNQRRSTSQRNMAVAQPIPRTSSFLGPRFFGSAGAHTGSIAAAAGGHVASSRPSSSVASLPGSPHSRALAFASSLRNAPMGTQMLAEGSRRSSLQVSRPHSRGWLAIEAVHAAGAAAPAAPGSPYLGASAAASQKQHLRAVSGRSRGIPPAAARDFFLRSRRSVDVGHAIRIATASRTAASAYSLGEDARLQTEIMPDTITAAAAAAAASPLPPPTPYLSQGTTAAAVHSVASMPVPACLLRGGGGRGGGGRGGGGGDGGEEACVRDPQGGRAFLSQTFQADDLRCATGTTDAITVAVPPLSDGTVAGAATDGVEEPTASGRGGADSADAARRPAAIAASHGGQAAPHAPPLEQQDAQSVPLDANAAQPARSVRAPAASSGRVNSWSNAILARMGTFPRSSRRAATAATRQLATGGAAVGPSVAELLGLSTGSLAPTHGTAPNGSQPQSQVQSRHQQQQLEEALSEGQEPQQLPQPDGVAGPEAGARSAPAVAASPLPGDCWHEIWATAAVDPITGESVVVLSQHDVTAKVVAERHLALVMEAEHRLLEQLFPKHILTHVTEEWIAEAERGAAGGAAAAPPARQPAAAAAASGTARSAGPCGGGHGGSSSEWRPVVRDCNALATWHPQVTLLFADIKGFTPMCKQVTPREVMTMLNQLFSRFDAMLDKFGVFKVETIGDCYFVAGGLIQEDEDGMAAVRDGDSRGDPLHAHKVFMFAKAMLAAAREVRMPSSGEPVQIRIGISSGPVVSGVVGTRMPRFCLFGDTVNTTSRMESTGQPGAIHASESAYALLKSEAWEATGGIEVKGKGLMQTYLWRPILEARGTTMRQLPASSASAAAAAAAALKLRHHGGGLAPSTAGGEVPYSPSGSAADNAQVAALAAAAAATAYTSGTVASAAATAIANAVAAALGTTADTASAKPTDASNAVDDYSDPLVAMLLNHAD